MHTRLVGMRLRGPTLRVGQPVSLGQPVRNVHSEAVHAAIEPDNHEMPPYERTLARIDGQPTAQELVPYIRRFIDFIDSWNGASITTPN